MIQTCTDKQYEMNTSWRAQRSLQTVQDYHYKRLNLRVNVSITKL